jgi:hypothetical protein
MKRAKKQPLCFGIPSKTVKNGLLAAAISNNNANQITGGAKSHHTQIQFHFYGWYSCLGQRIHWVTEWTYQRRMPKICSFLTLQDQVTLPGHWTFTWFDISRQQMVLFQDNTFYLWSPFGHDSRPAKLLSDPCFPDVVHFAKVSMDSKLLALLPSHKTVVVHDLKTLKQWKISIKNIPGNQILPGGLIWSEHGGNSQDLVVVTSKGIELHKVSSARGQCKLSRSIMQTTHHFCYEPNFRAILLGCKTRDGTINITGFFLRYDLSDAPRLELPPPDKMPSFRLEEGARAQDLKMIVLYGVLYLAVHYCGENEATDTLVLYDLSRGQHRITQTFSYPLYMSSDINLSVTDNILCCHCLQNQLTFLLDVRQCHDSEAAEGGGQMSFGACTLVLDEDSSLVRDNGPAGSHDITSPVKQLLQGEDMDGSPKHLVPHIMSALSMEGGEEGGTDDSSTSASPSPSTATKESYDALFIEAIFGTSRSSMKFEKDNDIFISPQRRRQQQQQQAHASPRRHVEEPYTSAWQFLAPNWVWDPHHNRLWKIKCNFSAVVRTVQSAERIVHFLSARGLPVQAPRPVFQADSEEDGADAKALLFYIIFRGIVDKQSDTWFYYLFTEFAKNYAVEYHKAEPSFASGSLSIGLVQRHSDMTDDSFLEQPPPPPPPPRGKLGSVSTSQSHGQGQGQGQDHGRGYKAAGESGKQSSSHPLLPARRLLNLARQAHAKRAMASGVSARRAGNVLDTDEGDEHWDDTRVGGASGPFLPDVTDEPLEPVGLVSNLVEISSIGQWALQNKSQAQVRAAGGSERRPSHHSAAASASSELQHNLQCIRRNADAGMIITQIEMLNHIWLPLSLEYTTSGDAKASENVDFLISALKVYISSLKTVAVVVNASISLLLLNLLAFREKYKELAHIIQLQFFSDSPEFAVALLDIADTMVDACASRCKQHDSSSDDCIPHRAPVQHLDQLQYAIATLQQAGRDILWRGQEHGTVIRWMLSHGQLDEALRLCIKFRSSFKNATAVVPGVDFFRAALADISSSLKAQKQGQGQGGAADLSKASRTRPWRQNKYEVRSGGQGQGQGMTSHQCRYSSEDDRVALLNSLHAFLMKWDASLFSFQQSTGRSRMAALVDFPEGLFNEDNTLMLKIKYGFVS